MALPAAFLDELRRRTPLASVVGRYVRLVRAGRDLKGCCPFHTERTPSFYVYADHYHCFGCGAHGDSVGFVMRSQGLGFLEAVEQLAAEAGLSVPQRSAETEAAERKRLDLLPVLEVAADTFQRRLHRPEGQAALGYLTGRGLTEVTIRRFGLGWSGGGRSTLAGELLREGVTEDQLIDAGLLRRDEQSRRITDLFFNRVMFPIRDRRGSTISFGGRALNDRQPKYVNGPETAVFSKRRNLYGLDQARDAVRQGAPLIVVEGYMDVISLSQAGFNGAVAPLGTSMTAEQLELLWQISPNPVLCFDGDAAGRRAGIRALERALPQISPERGLRVAMLMAGEDPDSLVRRRGSAAFQAVLDSARSLPDALYGLLRQGAMMDTPEGRAVLRTRLTDAAGQIQNKVLAAEYRRELLERFYVDTRARSSRAPGVRERNLATTRVSPLRPRAEAGQIVQERTRILTAILLRHPMLWYDVGYAYESLQLPPGLERLRAAMRDWVDAARTLDSKGLMDHLKSLDLTRDVERTLASDPVPLPSCAAAAAMPAEAEAGWWHIFGFLNIERLRREVLHSQARLADAMTVENQERHRALTEALRKVLAGESDGVERAA